MSDIVSQTEASNILGVNQPIISRYLKKGFIKRYGKSNVSLAEIREYRNVKQISIDDADSSEQPQKEQSPSTKQQKTTMTYSAARTHKEAFNAKLAEVSYKEKMKILIPLVDAKGAVEIMFSPLSRKLDDLHIDLKSRFPDIPLDAIEWLGDYVNEIKKSVSNYDWDK